MRIFKATYQDKKTRETKYAKNWYIEIRDHLGIPRRFTGYTDKNQTMALARKISKLVDSKLCDELPDRELLNWFECMPENLHKRLRKLNLLNNSRVSAKKSLNDHINDFHKFLQARGNTPEHSRQTHYRVSKICTGCKFVYWNDISASSVQFYIANLRKSGKLSSKTSNYYLRAIKQFCNWMLKDRRVHGESPVQYLDAVRVTETFRRRALTPDELRILLKTSENGPRRYGIEGLDRAMLYHFAVYTGLRANEIRSLKASSFDFDNCTVTVEAAFSKRRREDILPLRKDTMVAIREFLKDRMPGQQAFKLPHKCNVVRMFRADCNAAGINYEDNGQGRLDFHALRHTTGTLLAASGIHPKIAQSLMRHSDINLTMSRYTHVFRGQESQAIESLPDISKYPQLGQKIG